MIKHGVEFQRVFATQKHRMGLSIRAPGIERAEAKISLANIAFNLKCYLYWEGCAVVT